MTIKEIVIIAEICVVWICCIIFYIKCCQFKNKNRELSKQINQLNRFIHKSRKLDIAFIIESEKDCDEYAREIAAKNITNDIIENIEFEKRKDILTERTYYTANVSYLVEKPFSRSANNGENKV